MESVENLESREASLTSIRGLMINVKGLALVYKKPVGGGNPEPVKMRLPNATDHAAVFKITSKIQIGSDIETKTTVFSIPVGAKINITHTDAISTARLSLTKVLKMNRYHSAAEFKPVTELDKVSNLISVMNAEFIDSPNEDHKNDFERWKVDNLPPRPDSPPFPGKPRGKREFIETMEGNQEVISVIAGTVSFNVTQTMATRIEVIMPVDSTASILHPGFTITLGYQRATHILDISNLCDSNSLDCETKSDFLEYYQMLKPTSLAGSEFDFIMLNPRGSRAPCNVAYFEDGFNPET